MLKIKKLGVKNAIKPKFSKPLFLNIYNEGY